MRHRQNLLHNRTHFLRRMKHNMGEKNVVETHDPRQKGRSASAQDGAGMCTTPMSQPLTQPSHAPPTKVMRNRAHWLRRRKHDTGEWNVAGTHDAGEDTMSAGAQDGSVLCTTPMPHLLTQPSHALPTKPIAQQYLLAGTKEARHGREACCGRHNPEEKGRLVMGGGIPMHHAYAIIPSRNPRMHCRRTPFVQPYSQAATKEP